MKKNKEIYSQPTSKLLVVRFEKRILTGSDTGMASLRSWTEEDGENDLDFE